MTEGTSMYDQLPIDVVPNTSPPKFRWRQTVSTLDGPRVAHYVDRLPATVEEAVKELIDLAKAHKLAADAFQQRWQVVVEQCAKLQAFKDWVHAYLDAHGVPKEFPDGPHTREGCRIGDRMDWLVKQLSSAKTDATPKPVPVTEKRRR